MTLGSAVSSKPAVARRRVAVASVGDFRPCSYAEIVVRDVRVRGELLLAQSGLVPDTFEKMRTHVESVSDRIRHRTVAGSPW